MDSNVSAGKNPRARGWTTYLKGILFLAPPLVAWGLTAVFVAPKVKQIWAMSGGERSVVFSGMDFVQDYWLWITIALAATIFALEKLSSGWSRYRQGSVAAVVFAVNTLVIASITGLLISAMMAAPSLIHASAR